MNLNTIFTLDELFKLWDYEQKNESPESCQKTFPYKKDEPPLVSEFKESFCPDGYLSDSFNGVLIICRESNVSSNKPMGEFNNVFAMADPKIRTTNYDNFIKKALNFLAKNEGFNGTTEKDQCAYMNLNKRGGYGKTDMSRLKNYVKAYEDFIKKEIELLNPDFVVCGGTYDCVKDLLPNNVIVLDCWHPVRGFHHKSTYKR
jgi:hypothetical protein